MTAVATAFANFTQTRTDAEKVRDHEIAKTIINQLTKNTYGIFLRGCLDIKGNMFSVRPNGLHIRGCLVQTGPNRRGNILVELNALDLYDITLVNRSTMEETRHENLDAAQMITFFARLGGVIPA